jgi:hypothetical protein
MHCNYKDTIGLKIKEFKKIHQGLSNLKKKETILVLDVEFRGKNFIWDKVI